jgi:crossover junction endodeoxyribonuclease RusA
MTQLFLPWPPTTGNHQHGRRRDGRGGVRIYVLDAIVTYRHEVAVLAAVGSVPCARGPVRVTLDLYPPDCRRRDADNCEKVIFDALVRAGVLEDDSCIREHTTRWHGVRAGGEVQVVVEEMA